ncbi:2,3-bisphosphoglycerate-dependent phosphoglycerate mutase, putative [Perkinsus marinus ATCC 50983]|uniref:2,3-bisphosphoglycerate-dependent phosphoglycerate mutase, putative n=1 Tax=Perkinsus marinus (strain ATCC 50983 / TXsc) TaxID=423536 RepID=C5K9V1_PERM5|nr:2,3-bisphosphoglycerate-dependent phosphoglycerate mutase, putative [Perkinsus marinus ATCC 50983]EER18873.1 2,3-bisphosphoglycerate-dependent phosphoglycerate mutase, putative [Perkinsus marinus ATCC 50983]|eukprot:XP_002787077.1 2,3-bisphosphoglycerate-dependent phosphoglycerate mutase, putative [Perkinsus marinus ATCC 50983]
MPDTTPPIPPIFLIRHGQSEANVANLIVSNPEVGCKAYGLTGAGREQVKASARAFLSQYKGASMEMEIVSSDFLRTRETAEVFASVVGFPKDKIQFDTRLRERFFGSIDMTSDGSYAKVWQRDAHHESLEDFNAEEPDSVAARSLAVLKEHIKTGSKALVLVTHGDVMQILQTTLLGFKPYQYRTAVDNVNQGELRRVDPKISITE